MRTVTVNITAEDIGRGVPCCSVTCPAAHAIVRDANVRRAVVGLFKIYLNLDSECLTPPELAEWMTRFDRKLPVEPLSFTLNLPEENA